MATFTADVQIDFSREGGFFYAGPESVVSLTSSQITLKAPNGFTQIYEGSFSYTYSGGYQFLDPYNSYLTALKEYAIDGSYVAGATGMSISGIVYKSYADANDSFGLRSYAFRSNDSISGSSCDDVLFGYAGNDTIKGKGSNDILNGGDGQDTAIYTGAASSYTITGNSDGSWTVTDSVAGRDGKDSLFNIELLQFSDSIVDLTTPGKTLVGTNGNDTLVGSNKVDAVVLSGLPSQYNLSGIWLTGIEGTDTVSSIEQFRFGSSLGNDAFVSNLSASALVDPDGAGPAVSPAKALLQNVSDLYVAFFNRAPDVNGLMYWFTEISKGSLTPVNQL